MLLVALALLFCLACGHGQHEQDGVFELLGYNPAEAALFFETLDKRKLRERAAALEPPPVNLLPNDNHYAGGMVGTERHGVGVLTIGGPRPGQHDVHTGVFKRGRRHGLAVVEVWEGGESTVYSGDYWNDVQHGDGVLQSAGGHVYDGQWLFGSQWGRGRYTSDKWQYAGEWRNGEPHGVGVELDLVNGIKHEGHFANGKKHGPGVSTRLADGAVRRGEWADNAPVKRLGNTD